MTWPNAIYSSNTVYLNKTAQNSFRIDLNFSTAVFITSLTVFSPKCSTLDCDSCCFLNVKYIFLINGEIVFQCFAFCLLSSIFFQMLNNQWRTVDKLYWNINVHQNSGILLRVEIQDSIVMEITLLHTEMMFGGNQLLRKQDKNCRFTKTTT